jgi:hypothetical protein
MNKYVRSIFIVSAADQAEANAAAKEVDTAGGENTFASPLEDSSGSIVAYICNWQFEDAAERASLISAFARRGIMGRVTQSDYTSADPASDLGKADRQIKARGYKKSSRLPPGRG